MAQHELSIRDGLRTQRDCRFDDFYINNKRLSDVLKVADSVSPFGWLGTPMISRSELEKPFAKMLLGLMPSNLRSDRIPVFVCGECADYSCGVTTCRVVLSTDRVEWRDFGWDNYDEEETRFEDRLLGHHFIFDRPSYEATLSRYLTDNLKG